MKWWDVWALLQNNSLVGSWGWLYRWNKAGFKLATVEAGWWVHRFTDNCLQISMFVNFHNKVDNKQTNTNSGARLSGKLLNLFVCCSFLTHKLEIIAPASQCCENSVSQYTKRLEWCLATVTILQGERWSQTTNTHHPFFTLWPSTPSTLFLPLSSCTGRPLRE